MICGVSSASQFSSASHSATRTAAPACRRLRARDASAISTAEACGLAPSTKRIARVLFRFVVWNSAKASASSALSSVAADATSRAERTKDVAPASRAARKNAQPTASRPSVASCGRGPRRSAVGSSSDRAQTAEERGHISGDRCSHSTDEGVALYYRMYDRAGGKEISAVSPISEIM